MFMAKLKKSTKNDLFILQGRTFDAAVRGVRPLPVLPSLIGYLKLASLLL
jgi:hypothetical protein